MRNTPKTVSRNLKVAPKEGVGVFLGVVIFLSYNTSTPELFLETRVGYRIRQSFVSRNACRNTRGCVEGKIYSQTDIISDRRLQRSKHSSNCARSSQQQDMLALGQFSIPENIVVCGDRKSGLKIRCKNNA